MPTKLGPHCILTTDAGLRWARRAPIVKSLDRLAPLRAAQDGAILVFRHYWPDQGLVLKHGGAWAAQVVITKLQGFHHSRLYLEGMNETCQRLGQGLEEYVVWQRQFSDYCHARGYKVVGFHFSTGNPYIEDWLYLEKERWSNVDAIGIREYWGNQRFTRYHALRHRWVHEEVLCRRPHPPFMILETGRDRIEGCEWGWRAAYPGVDDEEKARRFVAECKSYDRAIQQDPYVLGATPFTNGPTGDWWAFDMDGVSDEMEGGEPMPAPPPTPEPEPTPVGALAERFPVIYGQWIETGGDPEGEFQRHLLGIGVLPPTQEAYSALCESGKSLFEQIKLVGLRLPKA